MNFRCPSPLSMDLSFRDSLSNVDVKGDEESYHANSHWEHLKAHFSSENMKSISYENEPEDSNNMCAIDLDFQKVQEDFRFVQEEVIFEDLYIPLQEDVTNLRRRIKEAIFPDEASMHTPEQEVGKTPIGLSEACENEAEASCWFDEGLEFEGYEIVPKYIPYEKKDPLSKSIHPHFQHALIQNTGLYEKKRNRITKRRLSKGLGKNKPKTIYVEKLTPRNSQDSLVKELQRKQAVSISRSR